MFNYTVKWSEEDKCFIARSKKYSLLACHGDTKKEALKELKKVIKFCESGGN